MALHGNNGQFPLAYAVIENKCDEEWGVILDAMGRELGAIED